MKLLRTLLLAGVAAGACATALSATDYYVQPVKPGPVSGTPLASVSLQAATDEADDVLNLNELGNTAGKWVRVGDDDQTTVVSPTTTTTTTAAASTSTSTSTSTASTQTAASTSLPALTNVSSPDPATTYPNFAALVKSGKIKGGDRVFLLDGYHGDVLIKGVRNASPVTVAPMPGQTAHMSQLHLYDSSNFVFRDLKVWATSTSAPTTAMIRTIGSTTDVTFANLDVRSVETAPNYVTWNFAAWTANQRGGFLLDGNRITAIGNRITGARNSLLSQADNALIANNIIDGFSGDGMRANGDNTIVRGNKIQNCFKLDASHQDGIQSFSMGPGGPGTGTIYNLTIENNKIFEWNTTATNALRCKLQGISMFDGMYENTVIRNNLVSVNAYHGLTIAGSRNGLITQNTVVNASGIVGPHPWIKIAYHKNGTPASNTMVANNTAMSVKLPTNTSLNVTAASNVVVTNFTTEFVSPTTRNYALQATAKSANAASTQYMTPADIAGTARPKGKGPDAGAYESQ